MRAALWATLLLLLPVIAFAQDVTQFPGLSRQTLQLTTSAPDGSTKVLEALVVRPDGPGPFPLVLISHGTNRLAETFPAQRPEIYTNPALAFAQRGYAAVVVMRRGFGRSTGPYAENIGPCDETRSYLEPSKVAAGDVLAALSDLRNEAWVDPARVLLVGHSTGGIADLAASATNPSGILGVISFAGANGSARPDYVCQPDRLVEAFLSFGQTARIPSLWIYSENDHFINPDLARRMFDAYTASGAPASLFVAPSWGSDGHSLIWAPDETVWWPQVRAFLASLHLPTDIVVTLAAPAQLASPASLDNEGRAAFGRYLQSRSYEKAFAIATNAPGHWGWTFSERTKADAESAALKSCQKLERVCQVYAVGNDLKPASEPPG